MLHIPYKVIIIKKQEKIFLPRSMLDGKINYFGVSPCCLLCFTALQKQGYVQMDLNIQHNHFQTEKTVSYLNCDNFSSVWKLLPWVIHFLSPLCLLFFSLLFLPHPFLLSWKFCQPPNIHIFIKRILSTAILYVEHIPVSRGSGVLACWHGAWELW